jgi:hypothetical protein
MLLPYYFPYLPLFSLIQKKSKKFTTFKKPIDGLCAVVVGYSIPWKLLRIKRVIIEVWNGCKSGAI